MTFILLGLAIVMTCSIPKVWVGCSVIFKDARIKINWVSVYSHPP